MEVGWNAHGSRLECPGSRLECSWPGPPPHDLGRGREHALQATGLRHAAPRHLRTRVHHQGNCLKATYLEYRMECPGSRLECPGSRLECPGSRLECPGSRLECPGRRLESHWNAHGRRLECFGNRLESPGSRLECPGRRLECHGSRLEYLWKKVGMLWK